MATIPPQKAHHSSTISHIVSVTKIIANRITNVDIAFLYSFFIHKKALHLNLRFYTGIDTGL